MAATRDIGTEQFWVNGLPAGWLPDTNDVGTEQFWSNGIPANWVDEPAPVVRKKKPWRPIWKRTGSLR